MKKLLLILLTTLLFSGCYHEEKSAIILVKGKIPNCGEVIKINENGNMFWNTYIGIDTINKKIYAVDVRNDGAIQKTKITTNF